MEEPGGAAGGVGVAAAEFEGQPPVDAPLVEKVGVFYSLTSQLAHGVISDDPLIVAIPLRVELHADGAFTVVTKDIEAVHLSGAMDAVPRRVPVVTVVDGGAVIDGVVPKGRGASGTAPMAALVPRLVCMTQEGEFLVQTAVRAATSRLSLDENGAVRGTTSVDVVYTESGSDGW